MTERALSASAGERGVDEELVAVARHDEPPLLELLGELARLVAQLEAEPVEQPAGVLVVDLDLDPVVVPRHYAGILPYSARFEPTTRSEIPVWSRCFVIPPRKNG